MCIRYLLINDVFVNYLGVALQCALLSIDCHNSTASVACDSHGTFFGLYVEKQCLNDFVNCSYGRGGDCYNGDCAKCPNVTANLSTTVVEFQISNDSCTVNISVTDTQGDISNSSAVEIANCKFMYIYMYVYIPIFRKKVVSYLYMYKRLPTI